MLREQAQTILSNICFHSMRHKLFKTILLSWLTALTASAGCSREASDDASPRFYEQITSADKLVLASMAVTKSATVSDGNREGDASLADRMKIGSRVAAYSYDTYLRAFIDLGQLKPSDIVLDRETRTMTITLPPIETEVAGRDAALREEHYRVTGMRSEIDPRERAALKERMNASLMAEIVSDPRFDRMLTNAAREKAAAFINRIAEAEGYAAEIIFQPSQTLTDN